MKLTDDQLNEIDDALMTGSAITGDTASAIEHTYGINPNSPDRMRDINGRYNHPTVGPTGRRALDALRLYIVQG